MPIKTMGKDQPTFDSIINKVQSTIHAYTKYLSNSPTIHIPIYNPTSKSLGMAKRRKRILELWLKENSWIIKWITIVRSCSMFGYQGIHLGIEPTMETKFAIILDNPNNVYAIPKAYDDTKLDLYMVTKRISGKQIYDKYLGGGKPYGAERPIKRKFKNINIEDDPDKFYNLLIVWDDFYVHTIEMESQKQIGELLYHGLGEPPAVMLKNFPNPGNCEGISDIAHVIGLNYYLNSLLNNMADIIQYQANPIGIAKKVPQDLDVSKMIEDDGIIQFEDEKSTFEFVKHPGSSNEASQLYEMMSNSLEEQTSMTKLASSGNSGSRKIDSGPAVSNLNIGVEAMLNLKKQLLSEGLGTLFGLYLKSIDSIYKPELFGKAANINVGSPDTDSAFTFNADDIKGEYNVEVVFTEGVFDMVAKINTAIQMQQAGLICKRYARQMCNIKSNEDQDKMIELEKEKEIEYEAKLAAAKNGELQPQQETDPNAPANGQMMDQLMAATGGGGGEMPPDMGMGGGMPQGMPQGMPPEMGGGMPADISGGGMPPELSGMGGSGMPPAAQEAMGNGVEISDDITNPNAELDEETISAKLDKIQNLKGEAILVGIQNNKIIIALEDMADKKTVLDAMPEYSGMIEFIKLTEDMKE